MCPDCVLFSIISLYYRKCTWDIYRDIHYTSLIADMYPTSIWNLLVEWVHVCILYRGLKLYKTGHNNDKCLTAINDVSYYGWGEEKIDDNFSNLTFNSCTMHFFFFFYVHTHADIVYLPKLGCMEHATKRWDYVILMALRLNFSLSHTYTHIHYIWLKLRFYQ